MTHPKADLRLKSVRYNFSYVHSCRNLLRGSKAKTVRTHVRKVHGGNGDMATATSPNSPQRRILTNYFNNYNFS